MHVMAQTAPYSEGIHNSFCLFKANTLFKGLHIHVPISKTT